MTLPITTQLLRHPCGPGPTSGGRDDLAVAIREQQRQITAMQAAFQQLSAQAQQGLEVLTTLSSRVGGLTGGSHTGGDLAACLEHKLLELECDLAQVKGRLLEVDGRFTGYQEQFITIRKDVVEFSARLTELQAKGGHLEDELTVQTQRIDGATTGLASAQNSIGAIEARLDDLSNKATAQVKLSEDIQAQVTAQAASIASAESAIATLTSRVERSERRWRWLWGYCQLLPLHLPGCPPTPCSQLLQECGLGDLRALSGQSPPDLARALAAQNAQSRRLDEDPDEDDAAELVRHAKATQSGPAKKA